MDCESRCRSKSHAQELNVSITKGTYDEAKCFIQRCHNFGKVTDGHGRSLLHMAASCGREELLLWLLSTGKMDINQKDKESGWTPLHRAVFYGHLRSAVILIRAGASLTIRDNEGLSALDLAMKDLWQFPFIQLTKAGLVKHGNADVYTWGDNSNYTLGHRSEQNRNLPDIVEFFSKHETSIKEVVMSKYHSIFLSLDGRLFVCGHGRGGRLGLGHEEAAFQPVKVSSLGTKCIAVASGRDHSLFLMEGGAVYGCGLNEYYQLGDQADGSKKLLVPKPVVIKSLKGKPAIEQVIGICAGRYHSAFYTATSLFTVGLNAGQLGHLKSDAHDPCQKQPRVVSALHQHGSGIKQVCSSDAAIAVLLTTGEIYVLHEYQCRKITKYSGCIQLAVCGGHLDHRLDPGVLCELGGSELVTCALGATGQVFMWRETWQSFARLDWNIGRQITVTDMALSLFDLLVCTSEGEAFRITLSNVKRDRVVDDKWDHFTVASARGATGAAAASDTVSRRVADARARRIAGIHRAIAIALDHKSTCFSVLQAQPVIENSFVMIPESSFVQDFESLLETADIYDGLADVHLQVDGESVPSHAYILACRSEHFRSHVCSSTDPVPRLLPVPAGINAEVLHHVLRFIYSGRLDIAAAAAAPMVAAPAASHRRNTPLEESADVSWQSSDAVAVKGSTRVGYLEPSSVADPDADGQPQHGRGGASSNVRGSTRGKAKAVGSDAGFTSATAAAEHGLGMLKDIARALKVKELLDRVSSVVPHRGGFMVTKTVPQRLPTFRRDRFSELHDIVLVSSDGQELPCHKCVLSARLEYFRTMLSTVWIHGSTDSGDGDVARLDLAIPADVLRAVVDYLYMDDLALGDGSRSPSTVDILCNVLVVADQWLLTRLKSICEARLVAQLTQKSVWPLLAFALLYNASSLAESCREFVCLNLACTLEMLANDSSLGTTTASLGSGTGDDDDDFLAVLRSVSTYYRQHLPCMSRRLITPYAHDSPSASELARAYADSLGAGTAPPSGCPAAACGSGGEQPLQSGSPSRSSKARRRDRLVSASSSWCCASDGDLSTSPMLATAAVPTATAAATTPLSSSAASPAVTPGCVPPLQLPTSTGESAKRPAIASVQETRPGIGSSGDVGTVAAAARPPHTPPARHPLAAAPSSLEAGQFNERSGAALSSLRHIMHEEEVAIMSTAAAQAAATGAGDGEHSSLGCGDAGGRVLSTKTAKLSQREKKKLASAMCEEAGKFIHLAVPATSSAAASVAGHSSPGRTGKTQPESQPHELHNAWGMPRSLPVVSLRDVMTGQSQPVQPAGKPAGRPLAGPPPVAGSHPASTLAVPAATAPSAARQALISAKHVNIDKPAVVAEAAAWSGHTPGLVACGTGGSCIGDVIAGQQQWPELSLASRLPSPAASSKPMPFQLIVDAELRQSENQMKLAKKPLSLIQIEELAIAELYSHYRALASCDSEQLTVERLSTAQAGNVSSCTVLHSWAAHASPQK